MQLIYKIYKMLHPEEIAVNFSLLLYLFIYLSIYLLIDFVQHAYRFIHIIILRHITKSVLLTNKRAFDLCNVHM